MSSSSVAGGSPEDRGQLFDARVDALGTAFHQPVRVERQGRAGRQRGGVVGDLLVDGDAEHRAGLGVQDPHLPVG